jgi:hypothetical protein
LDDCGLDFIPIETPTDPTDCTNPAGARWRASWDALRHRQPELFAKLEKDLDATLRATWDRARATHALPELKLEGMTFYDKLRLNTLYHGICAMGDPQAALQPLWMTGGDIWNRTGVMTLIERQKCIEALTGKNFAAIPKGVADEEPWFNKLMADKTFRKYYDAIPWSSSEVERIFAELAASKYFAPSAPLASSRPSH